MNRKICIEKSKEPVYKALAEGENAVFASYKDVFLMAACIGYSQGQKTPLEETMECIELQSFDGATDISLMNAIALQDQKDFSVLLGDEATTDKCLSVIEDYANAGLDLLKRRVLENPGDPVDNLMEMIVGQYAAENETKEDSVTSVMQAMFN